MKEGGRLRAWSGWHKLNQCSTAVSLEYDFSW